MANIVRNRRKCFTFIWKVENMYYHKKVKAIQSPEFIMDEIGDTKWNLHLFTKYSDKGAQFVGLELGKLPETNGVSNVTIDYQLSLFSDGILLKSLMKTEIIFSEAEVFEPETLKQSDFLIADLPAPRDILTFRCEVWKSAGEFSEDVRCVARTCIGFQTRSFIWNVGNFSTLKPKEKHSYQIKSLTTREELMTLDLLLTGDETIRFAVTRIDQRITFSTFQLSLVNSFGKPVECLRNAFKFDVAGDTEEFAQFFGKAKLMEKEDVYLPDDILSLRCECTFSFGMVLEEIQNVYDVRTTSENSEVDSLLLDKQNALSSPKRDLIDNLKSMLNNSCHSDIKLRTSTKTYPVHKCILSSRSPVFKSMFADKMKENINHCVDIDDLNDDTVLRMLQYIYSADVDELEWDIAIELYKAADKYEVLSLKNICLFYLKKNLHRSNVCEALVLADLHQDENLKSVAQDFILRHAEEIINSEDWKKMMESHLKLAAETMRLKFEKTAE